MWPPDLSAFEESGGWSRVALRVLQGRAVSILGGGPSLSRGLADALRRVGPVITVNNAYMLAPEAPLVALDRRWWGWHGKSVAALRTPAIAALRSPNLHTLPDYARVLRRDTSQVYNSDPRVLCGQNSGHAAIHLAMHLGATRIYLAGFDMGYEAGPSHWHEGHPVPATEANYRVRFKPDLELLALTAQSLGVRIFTVTPSRAALPTANLTAALKDLSQ